MYLGGLTLAALSLDSALSLEVLPQAALRSRADAMIALENLFFMFIFFVVLISGQIY